jgi:hypothetical protein
MTDQIAQILILALPQRSPLEIAVVMLIGRARL